MKKLTDRMSESLGVTYAVMTAFWIPIIIIWLFL